MSIKDEHLCYKIPGYVLKSVYKKPADTRKARVLQNKEVHSSGLLSGIVDATGGDVTTGYHGYTSPNQALRKLLIVT